MASLPASGDGYGHWLLIHRSITDPTWQALFENAGLKAGQTLLINGAGGGVGGQLAVWTGATVTVDRRAWGRPIQAFAYSNVEQLAELVWRVDAGELKIHAARRRQLAELRACMTSRSPASCPARPSRFPDLRLSRSAGSLTARDVPSTNLTRSGVTTRTGAARITVVAIEAALNGNSLASCEVCRENGSVTTSRGWPNCLAAGLTSSGGLSQRQRHVAPPRWETVAYRVATRLGREYPQSMPTEPERR